MKYILMLLFSIQSFADVTPIGQYIYENRCLKCHGATGKGDGPSADLLAVKPADFTDSKNLPDDATMAKVIRYGGESIGKSKLMQGFPELVDKDIKEVRSEE